MYTIQTKSVRHHVTCVPLPLTLTESPGPPAPARWAESEQFWILDCQFWIPESSDNSVGSSENVRRNRQADLFSSFQIDHELELHRLLNRKVSGLGAFQDLVDVGCGASIIIRSVRTVGHKAPIFYKTRIGVDHRQPTFFSVAHEFFPVCG